MMRGHTVKTPERVAEAQRLRAEGLTYREIGERFGVGHRTVFEWITDPDGARLRARKDGYRGTCEDCGDRTSGSAGPSKAPDRCQRCAAVARRTWTEQAIVAAIRRFAERYGRPPAATDFNPPHARTMGHAYRAERFYSDGDYPYMDIVRTRFGTWNAAIVAAGYSPRSVGAYPHVSGARRGGPTGAHLAEERAAA